MYCAYCKIKARGVLDKYDEEIEGKQEQSFVLGKHALQKVNRCCWLCLLNDLWCIVPLAPLFTVFIIHQTHYEKSDWSRAFNQFTIACELQILHLSCQVQRLPGYQAPWSVLLRNRMAERFASVSEDELCRLIEEKDSKNTKCILYSDKGFIIVF